MPEAPRELYEEARVVYGASPRAGAALARATLERLLRDIDPAAGRVSLETRIERIVPKVSSSLAQELTVLRHVGNKSLHQEDTPDELTILVVSDEQTEFAAFLFEAINSLVDELITRPAASSDRFAKLPAAIRQKVESQLNKDQQG